MQTLFINVREKKSIVFKEPISMKPIYPHHRFRWLIYLGTIRVTCYIEKSEYCTKSTLDSNDIVKIEVWDVVDKAHNKTKASDSKGIKLEHNTTETETPVPIPSPSSSTGEDISLGLDASTVNVYRNSHGAVFLFDTTKPWTFDYVNTELANVPETISVLVLGNFSDKV